MYNLIHVHEKITLGRRSLYSYCILGMAAILYRHSSPKLTVLVPSLLNSIGKGNYNLLPYSCK